MFKNLSLALFVLLLACASTEVYYRVKNHRRSQELLGGLAPELLTTRPTYDSRVYELIPNTKFTNSDGFRDRERYRKKKSDTFRVAVLGDSVSMQRGISFDDLWINKLQQIANSWAMEDSIEFLNFAITGYSTSQQFSLLRKQVMAFSPDAILWQFHYNDSADPTTANADGGLLQYHQKPFSYGWMYVSRRIDAALRKRFLKKQGLESAEPELVDQLYRWDTMGDLLQEIYSFGRERSLPIYFFIYPSWPRSGSWNSLSEESKRIHEKLVSRFRNLEFKVLDLMPAFQEFSPEALRFSIDDPWHPNVLGHEVIATEVGSWLENDENFTRLRRNSSS